MNTPAISVIMAVYNGAEYLEEAVYSILYQTFTDFEYIIVDDASTDDTPNMLARLASEDARIRILTNTENKERSFSRNKAIHAAKAPYIALMDADDWAYPKRLAKQYAFMEAHPHVSLCATWFEIYETNKLYMCPCSNEAIRATMFFQCCFHHPTIILRKDIITMRTQGYDESMPPSEDYDLWTRLMEHEDIIFVNLPEVLLRYRVYPNKDRAGYYTMQEVNTSKVHFRLQQQLGIAQPNKDLHSMMALAKRTNDSQKLRQCGQWMQEVSKANEQKKLYDHEVFLNELHIRWLRLCFRSFPSTFEALSIYKQYTLTSGVWYVELAKALLRTCIKRVHTTKNYLRHHTAHNS